jgi:NAD(P)H-hydrate repair Nnr-like enzyme with NAD(P)H-hydrate dehydratase domain
MWRKAEDLLTLDHLARSSPGRDGLSAHASATARCVELPLPLQLDADALNLAASHEPLRAMLAAHATISPTRRKQRVCWEATPSVQSNRVAVALELAERFRAAVDERRRKHSFG